MKIYNWEVDCPKEGDYAVNQVSIAELYRVARLNEEKGFEFYRKLEKRAETEQVRRIAEILKNAEESHMKDFLKIYDDIVDPETPLQPNEILADREGLQDQYLDMYFPNQMFQPENVMDIDTADLYSLLLHAVKMEKDSIEFYLKLKELERKPEIQTFLDKIIAEERGHLSMLNELFSGIGL